MDERQIKYMVDRFLGWRFPENFNPDGGISFKRYGNVGTPHQYEHRPTGTNVLDAQQAEAMIRYLVQGIPPAGTHEFTIDKLASADEWGRSGSERE